MGWVLLSMLLSTTKAQNPLITNIFTADPAAHQFSDGRLYLYADYDPNGENRGWLNMFKFHVYSTSDLKIWTDHGSLFDCKDITWNDGAAWDGDCVEANGKYYYYFPMVDKIGVAVSDNPIGPFKDALGKPLITRDYPGVQKKASGWLTSPCVLFYNDTAYMYMGQNEEFYLAKLKKNMVEVDGPVLALKKPAHFHEGAWVNYAHGKFHATYGGNDGKGKDKLAYAVADNPHGPFVFQRFIQPNQAATVQSSVVSFNGRNLLFYHQNGTDDFHRQICVEDFQYTSDGLIPVVPRTKEGIGPVELRIDALGKQEAEDYQEWSDWGLECIFEPTGEGNRLVNVLAGNTWIMFNNVDFGTGVRQFETMLSSPLAVEGGAIELRLDRPDGTLIGKCPIPKTNNWYDWEITQCEVSPETKGVQDLYLVFQGNTHKGFYHQVNYKIDFFRFKK
jgi:hypothetical protein